MRGTPKNRPTGQQHQAQFNHSPSGIPRPALEHHVSQNDAASTLSASRAKQTKRDEVCVAEISEREYDWS